MQVNAVHALLALVRQHRQGSGPVVPGGLKTDSVQELIEVTKATNMHLVMLERLLREHNVKMEDVQEHLQQIEATDYGKKELFVKFASTTSDSINQNAHEQHGRFWFKSSMPDSSLEQFQSYGKEKEIQHEATAAYDGVALPFKPTQEDLEAALQAGRKLYPELEVLARHFDLAAGKSPHEFTQYSGQYLYLLIAMGAVVLAVLLIL